MTTETVKSKTKTYLANIFKNGFSISDTSDVGFLYVGNGIQYANGDTEIITINDSYSNERNIWDDMIVAKRLNPNDLEIVNTRLDWSSGKRYKQYDDTKDADFLTEDDSSNNLYRMYVINSSGNVYKCISNNNNVISTVEPTGNYSVSDGFIETLDGYIWKYLFNVKQTNKFFDFNWIPTPFIIDKESTNYEYDINFNNVIQGSLNNVIVENGGSSYYETTLQSSQFYTGSYYIELPTLANVKIGMYVSGYGIIPKTYITEINTGINQIRLSQPTIYDGGGSNSNNIISITTRAIVEGDGTGALVEVEKSGDSISKIVINSIGENYSRANVIVYGTSNNAILRPIISPKYGHGSNPAMELNSNVVLIVKKFGEIDATEGLKYPVDISFRQYGVLLNPHKYNDSSKLTFENSNTIVKQYTTLTLESGAQYNINDFVYQGLPSNPTFSGYIVSQEALKVKLTRCKGSAVVGSLLTNGTIYRPVVEYSSPDLEPYSGDILNVTNINKTQRSLGQSEVFKIAIEI